MQIVPTGLQVLGRGTKHIEVRCPASIQLLENAQYKRCQKEKFPIFIFSDTKNKRAQMQNEGRIFCNPHTDRTYPWSLITTKSLLEFQLREAEKLRQDDYKFKFSNSENIISDN